jgi:ribosome-interacting GTPase 1
MGLGKRDLDRKRKSLENKLKELEEKARKNPLNKALQQEVEDFKKKLKE